MKNKSKRCSTGHGTGVSHVADLRTILARIQWRRRHRLKGTCFGTPQEPVGMRKKNVKGKLFQVPRKKYDYEKKVSPNPYKLREAWISWMQKVWGA